MQLVPSSAYSLNPYDETDILPSNRGGVSSALSDVHSRRIANRKFIRFFILAIHFVSFYRLFFLARSSFM